ncbi:MAG: histidine phosphatase family protein [Actinomycetaceae bacterium]|nr:histidine phosphatase family protein [Actinomycetaceae bacterium]
MRLVLVRHGQTVSNTLHALDTAMPGAELDEEGLAQAEELAQNFERLVGGKPSVLYVSPLTRTQQTARPLAEKYGLEPIIREGVREVIAGDIEMSTTPEDVRTYMRTFIAWVEGDLDVRMPGAQNGHETLARTREVLDEALSNARETIGEDAIVVVVAHGAISRVIASSLSADIETELVSRYPMDNTGTTVLEWVGGDEPWFSDRSLWRALTWSDKPIDAYELTGERVEPVESKVR